MANEEVRRLAAALLVAFDAWGDIDPRLFGRVAEHGELRDHEGRLVQMALEQVAKSLGLGAERVATVEQAAQADESDRERALLALCSANADLATMVAKDRELRAFHMDLQQSAMSFTTMLLQIGAPTPEAWKVIREGATLLRASAADSFGAMTGMAAGEARAQVTESEPGKQRHVCPNCDRVFDVATDATSAVCLTCGTRWEAREECTCPPGSGARHIEGCPVLTAARARAQA